MRYSMQGRRSHDLLLALGDVLPAKAFWRRDIKTCAKGALTKKPVEACQTYFYKP